MILTFFFGQSIVPGFDVEFSLIHSFSNNKMAIAFIVSTINLLLVHHKVAITKQSPIVIVAVMIDYFLACKQWRLA